MIYHYEKNILKIRVIEIKYAVFNKINVTRHKRALFIN